MNEQPQTLLGNRAIAAVAVFCLLLLAVFYQTSWSIVSIWLRSDTFAHGFLIVPIVLWILWQKQSRLRSMTAQPVLWPALFLLGAGFAWLLAQLVDVLVIQQFALVAMLIIGIWMLLGTRLAWAMAFPLAYLFFAVPVGEDLVPPMMEITADFTVWAVRATGIPVFREGLYFSLPSGSWSVVEACSGVRYLIASVTLGCLYAYITYEGLYKRIVFIGFSILVPIAANGVRAYMIVMIGHLSGMKYATGVDHLIYGWVFFGLVMLILFAVGSIWRDAQGGLEADDSSQPSQGTGDASKRMLPALACACAVAILWPVLATLMLQEPAVTPGYVLSAPGAANGWQASSRAWNWAPEFKGASGEVSQFYSNEQQMVELALGHYLFQRQGQELVDGRGLFSAAGDKTWRIIQTDTVSLNLAGTGVNVQQALIRGGEQYLQVLAWYRVGERYTANPYIAKLYEAWGKLSFGKQDAARITLATPVQAETARNTRLLQEFIDAMLPEIETALDSVQNSAEDNNVAGS